MRRFLFLGILVSSFVFAQNTPPTSTDSYAVPSSPRRAARSSAGAASPYFGAGPISPVVVTAAPYSADGQSQNVRTLADGTVIKGRLLSWKFYRDAQGRTRVERPAAATISFAQDAPPEVIIEITDPVAQLKYTLDTAHKVAQRQHWIAPASGSVKAPSPLPIPVRDEKILPPESLGTQTIEGLSCEGTRVKFVWPVGSIGNDRELSAVTETWKSPDLQLITLQKYNNPLTGDSTQKLFNIVRADPSPSLFQVPADYTMEDNTPTQTFESMPGVYKIGGSVSAPTLISKREPEYSDEASQAHISGSVLLSIIVQADGTPGNIKIVRPLGFGLDEKAAAAVNTWRFKPALKDGVPVSVYAQVEVTFRQLSRQN